MKGKRRLKIAIKVSAGLLLLLLMLGGWFNEDLVYSQKSQRGPAPSGAGQGRFVFAQLKYKGGDWDPYPTAPPELMTVLMRRTSVEAVRERRVLTISDPALFSYPFVYLTGTKGFPPFSDQEIKILRQYLNFGGLLFIDDVLGHRGQGFDRSIQRELARIFPDRKLEKLPRNHTVFRSFYLITSVAGRRIASPYLEGITLDDLAVVIYSRNDLGGAWARDYSGHWENDCLPGGQLQRQQAFHLGVNIIMYALTANYKQDFIHQPFLKKKLRR